MLRRTILGGLLLAAVVLVSASAAISATTAATKPKLVFMTELDWTRTGTILQSSDGVECRVDVSMVGHGGPFYTARSRAPRNRVFRFGTTPSSRPMLTGYGYDGKLEVPGNGTVEIGATRCSDGRVDTRCAGVYRLPLVVGQIFVSRDRSAFYLNWAHRPPNGTPPPVPRACTDAHPGYYGIWFFVTQGFTGHYGCYRQAPFLHVALLSRSTVTSRAEGGDCHVGVLSVEGAMSRTTVRFQRVH